MKIETTVDVYRNATLTAIKVPSGRVFDVERADDVFLWKSHRPREK